MDKAISATQTTISNVPAAPPVPVKPGSPPPQSGPEDTVEIGSARGTATSEAPPVAGEKSSTDVPADVPTPEHPKGFVTVTVPLVVPEELLKPDKDGNVPLSQYQPGLIPPGAIYATKEEVQKLVAGVREKTLDSVRDRMTPPGYHPELDTSDGGHRVKIARQTLGNLAKQLSGLANLGIAFPNAWLAIPATVAAPLALVTGGIGLGACMDEIKDTLDLKANYEMQKKAGVQEVPFKLPNNGQTVAAPVDAAIQATKDTAVAAGGVAAMNLLIVGAGITALVAPPLAPYLGYAAMGTGVLAQMYPARHQLAAALKEPSTYGKLAGPVGVLAAYSLAHPGGWLTIPAQFAGPAAVVAGGLGLVYGIKDAHAALEQKREHEEQKKQGVESLPLDIPTPQGVQRVQVPIDAFIQDDKDTAIASGAKALGGAAIVAAGGAALAAIPFAPLLAVGGVAITAAGWIYKHRADLGQLLQNITQKLHGHQEEEEPASGPDAPATGPQDGTDEPRAAESDGSPNSGPQDRADEQPTPPTSPTPDLPPPTPGS